MNNAGIFLKKPFTDFTAEDSDVLVSTNLPGFFYVTQRTVKEMLKQKSGCVVSITAALSDRPIAGVNGSVSMITKGGLNSATQNLVTDSLGRYLLKLVGPRLPDQYRDLVVCGRTPTLPSEFLNCRIPLGTALAVLIEEDLGKSCDFESLVTTTNSVTVFNLVAKGAYPPQPRDPR